MFKQINDYGCDKCGTREGIDNGITWVTTSYGLCSNCVKDYESDDLIQLGLEIEKAEICHMNMIKKREGDIK